MNDRWRNRDRTWAIALAALGWMVADGTQLNAHRVDELLQSTFISIEPDSVRFDLLLTPGINIAPGWLAEVDANRDGQISKEEAAALGGRVGQALRVEIDHRAPTLTLLEQPFPSQAEVLDGSAVIRCSFRAQVSSFRSGEHLLSYENHHDPSRSVYLVNADVPSSSTIQVTRQHRDELQRAMHLDFEFRADPGPGSHPEALDGWPLTVLLSRTWGVVAAVGLAFLTCFAAAGIVWSRRRRVERADGQTPA